MSLGASPYKQGSGPVSDHGKRCRPQQTLGVAPCDRLLSSMSGSGARCMRAILAIAAGMLLTVLDLPRSSASIPAII